MNQKQQPAYTLDEALDEADGALMVLRRADRSFQTEYAVDNKRHMSEVMLELLGLAGANQEVAESCYYSVPRGGEPLQGPSIRFAELLSYCMSNTEVTSEFISVTSEEAIYRGRFVDAERNRVVQTDARRPVYKKRYKKEPDQDDKKIACEVAKALAFRNVVFAAVPRALWDPVYRAVLKIADGEKSIDERRRVCVDVFVKKGATQEEVLTAVGREAVADLTLKDLRHLKGMLVAMRDGVLSLKDAMRPREKDGKVKASGSSLGDRLRSATTPAPTPSPVAEEPNHDPKTGEVHEASGPDSTEADSSGSP